MGSQRPHARSAEEITCGRILVVDDEPAARVSMAAVLSEDFEVVEAASGAEALALMRERHFDVVISDLLMPGMSGLELLTHIAREFEGVSLVLVTGHNVTDVFVRLGIRAFEGRSLVLVTGRREYVRGKGASRVAYHVLLKPYDPDELIQTVQRARDMARLKSTPAELNADAPKVDGQ